MPAADDGPKILPYADVSIPAGLDDVQIIRVHNDVRRVIVPCGVSLEVTPYAFRLATAGPLGVRTSTWPRSAVTGVRVNRFDNRLVIELANADSLRVDVGTSPALAERVMHELIASLTVIPNAPAHRQTMGDAGEGSLPPSPMRSVLLRTSAILALVGVPLLCAVPPVGLILCIAAAVPVGIACGTQRKDLWT